MREGRDLRGGGGASEREAGVAVCRRPPRWARSAFSSPETGPRSSASEEATTTRAEASSTGASPRSPPPRKLGWDGLRQWRETTTLHLTPSASSRGSWRPGSGKQGRKEARRGEKKNIIFFPCQILAGLWLNCKIILIVRSLARKKVSKTDPTAPFISNFATGLNIFLL